MDALALETYLVNTEAEQYTLGSILYEPELIKDCTLKPEHFYSEKHQNLFYVMKDLDERGKPIDMVAIVERVGNTKVEKIGGISYISELAGSVPTTANFGYYQGVVFSYYERRQTYEIAKEMMRGITDQEEDAADIRQAAIEKMGQLEENNVDNDDGHIKKVLVRVYDWMEQDHGSISGAPTGFSELDNMLSGLQRQDLVVIGARPSMGKTAFANAILRNYASGEAGKSGPGALFSLEMPDEGIAKRMLSSEGHINAQNMRNPLGKFNDTDWGKTTVAMGSLSNMPLHIFDKPGVDVGYIRKKLRLLKKKYPDQHIVACIDYLQLIIGSPKHGGNRTAEIGEISRQLKQTARDLDMTIIALSQLSRGVEQRQDKRPMMSDLRESGQIEQDADVIGFLYRDDYYDKESEAKNITDVIIAKQRNGPIGTVQLAFVKEYGKFVNLERRMEG